MLEEDALPRHQGTTHAGTDMAVNAEEDVWEDRLRCLVRGSQRMRSAAGRKDQQ